MPNNEPKKRRGCLIPLAIFAVVLIAIIGGIAARGRRHGRAKAQKPAGGNNRADRTAGAGFA